MSLLSTPPLYYTPSAGLCQAYPASSSADGKYLVSLYQSQLYAEASDPSTVDSQPPPEYGSDCTVEKVTSKNRPSRPISIQFSHFSDNKKRTYSNGDCIIGTLIIAPTIPIQIESISLSLEGEEVIRNSTWSYDQYLRRHMKLARHEIVNLPRDSVLTPENLYKFPFSLEIPQVQSIQACSDISKATDSDLIRKCHHTCTSGVGLNHLKLPSTLSVHPNQSISPLIDSGSKHARVTYKLKPLIHGLELRTGLPYAATESDVFIKIVPSYPLPAQLLAPPPVPYNAFRQYSKKSGLSLISSSKKIAGTAQLTTNQYPIVPLYTCPDNPTKLALTVRYFPNRQNGTESNQGPPSINNVCLYLKSRTVSSYQTSITQPVFNPAHIKTTQLDNKLHEVISSAKGTRTNLVTTTSGSKTASSSTASLKSNTSKKQKSTIPLDTKKNSDNPSPQLSSAFKEEFKPHPITFVDKFPESTWTLKSPQPNVSIPTFNPLAQAFSTPSSTSSSSLLPGTATVDYPYAFYETQLMVPFTIPAGSRSYDIVPSYESCYTARDYTMIIAVEFGNGSSAATTTNGSSISVQPTGKGSSSSPSASLGSPLVLEIPAAVVTSITPAINTPDLLAYYADAASLTAEEPSPGDEELLATTSITSITSATSAVTVDTTNNMDEVLGGEEVISQISEQQQPTLLATQSTNETLTPGENGNENNVFVSTVSRPEPNTQSLTSTSHSHQQNQSQPQTSTRRRQQQQQQRLVQSSNSIPSNRPRGDKKYLEVLPLPPKFGDTPPYVLKASANETFDLSNMLYTRGIYNNNGHGNGIGLWGSSAAGFGPSEYPFPPAGVGLSQLNAPTTMMTTVRHYTGNQYHRIRENNNNNNS